MGNLVEIQGQIEKLQKQAAEIKSREFDKTVREIVAKMQAFGITAADLRLGKKKPGKSAPSKAGRKGPVARNAKPASTVAPKYRGPNGETWSGRGLPPRWLAALIAAGTAKESFLIKP